MHLKVILKIFGLFLMLFSLSMLPPTFIAIMYKDGGWSSFVITFIISMVAGFLIWFPLHNHSEELRPRDGFIIVVMFWIVFGSLGIIPYSFTNSVSLSFADSLFESFSGLTATGATVLENIDLLPKSVLFYRQQSQWFGGLGIIVLAVAILPFLGIGGMQLYKAETPGPIKNNKLAPRVSATAKVLWLFYVFLTLICALFYRIAGLGWFDAISHSFTTIATGGFSTHNASIGYYDSGLIEGISIFFMLISAVSFGLHFSALSSRNLGNYLKDSEFKFFMLYCFTASVIVISFLYFKGVYEDPLEAIRHGLFVTVSILTSTGYSSDDINAWPIFALFFLLCLGIIGGCAGSTAGGTKSIRFVLLLKHLNKELKQLINPNAIFAVKVNNRNVEPSMFASLLSFFALYLIVFFAILFTVMALGLDLTTALSVVISCLNNIGPALGGASVSFSPLDDSIKVILTLAMLLGRLEMFTLIIIFSRYFWRV